MLCCGTMYSSNSETGQRHFNNLCPLQERANCRRSIKEPAGTREDDRRLQRLEVSFQFIRVVILRDSNPIGSDPLHKAFNGGK